MQLQDSIQAGKMAQQVKVPATQPDFLKEHPGGRRELPPVCCDFTSMLCNATLPDLHNK